LLTEDFLYSGSFDHQIRKWDISSGQTTTIFKGHSDTITCLKRQGDSLYSGLKVFVKFFQKGSADNTVKVWNLYDGECILDLKGHTSWVWDVVFNSDFIFTAGMDSTIRKWSKKDGTELSTYKEHTDCVCKLALTSANSLVSASWDNSLMEFDPESGKQFSYSHI
jgi:WD40 repeat protein